MIENMIFIRKIACLAFLLLLFQIFPVNAFLHRAANTAGCCGQTNSLTGSTRWLQAPPDTGQIDHFIIAGQSNAVGKGDTAFSPKMTVAIGQQFWGGTIRPANDPTGPLNDTTYKGSAWPAFAIRYNQLTGHKVAFVQNAVGASSQVASVQPAPGGTWDTSGTLFSATIARSDSSIAAFTAMGYHVNNCGILWIQGEQDAGGIENGTTTGKDYYQRAIVMINNFRAHYGSNVPFYLIRTGADARPGHYGFDTIRNRQEQLAKAGYVIIVNRLAAEFVTLGLMNPIPYLSNLHYGQPGYNVIGTNAAENVVAGYKNPLFNKPSKNAELANLGVINGQVSPAFNSKITNYSATVTTDTTAVIPPAVDTASIVTVNGKIVPWGAMANNLKLAMGANTFTTTVQAQDGSATTTYTLTVNRVISSNAGLSGLAISKGALTPKFSTATTSYTVAVNNGVTSVTFTPTTSDAGAVAFVKGTAVSSGTASAPIALIVGSNVIHIVVVAADKVTKKTYIVTVKRAASTNAKLINLTTSAGALTPAFSNGITSYTRAVASTVSAITITPTAMDTTATITVNGIATASRTASGSIHLNVGANVINTVVTAQDGITKLTYSITVNRAVPANVKLASLSTSIGSLNPAFNNSVYAYTMALGNGITGISITPTTADHSATVKVNGAAVASGTASANVALNVGANVINTVVTAPDGVTNVTYKITVTRAASSNAKLLSLTANPRGFTPAFNNTTTSYSQAVANTVTSITFTPTAVDKTATITVNGVATPSGTSSASLPLAVGSNNEDITVTAQDGNTTINYQITVTRAAGSMNNAYQPIGVIQSTGGPQIPDDGVWVHPALSPNGDGINDFLVIEGITAHPDNKLQIMNRNGQLIFESKGYDNSNKVFDGRSNITGTLQLPGTYFYALDYTDNGVAKHKTGFIVLKY